MVRPSWSGRAWYFIPKAETAHAAKPRKAKLFIRAVGVIYHSLREKRLVGLASPRVEGDAKVIKLAGVKPG
jgi:hypothetical protein